MYKRKLHILLFKTFIPRSSKTSLKSLLTIPWKGVCCTSLRLSRSLRQQNEFLTLLLQKWEGWSRNCQGHMTSPSKCHSGIRNIVIPQAVHSIVAQLPVKKKRFGNIWMYEFMIWGQNSSMVAKSRGSYNKNGLYK